jgi:hypothetical protein
MKESGVAAVEMTYTALARIAAASGDAERAYEMVRCAAMLGHGICLRASKALASAFDVTIPTNGGLPDRRNACKRLAAQAAHVHARASMLLRGGQHRAGAACRGCQRWVWCLVVCHAAPGLRLAPQAVAIETDIRVSGIALSELEYTLLLRAMTGYARSSSAHGTPMLRCWLHCAELRPLQHGARRGRGVGAPRPHEGGSAIGWRGVAVRYSSVVCGAQPAVDCYDHCHRRRGNRCRRCFDSSFGGAFATRSRAR